MAPPGSNDGPGRFKAAGLYMICTLSKHKAEKDGYQDALMLDWRGQVAEATGANIFFSKDGVLHTPTPDCFLDGITRRTVMDLARSRGIEIIERAIMPEEMADFEECFPDRHRRRGHTGSRDRTLHLPARLDLRSADRRL